MAALRPSHLQHTIPTLPCHKNFGIMFNWNTVSMIQHGHSDMMPMVVAEDVRPATRKHVLRVVLATTLLLCDLLALLTGTLSAAWLSFKQGWIETHLLQISALVPLYGLSAGALRACTGEALIDLKEALKRGTLAFATTAGVIGFLLFVTENSARIPPAFVALSLIVAVTFLVIFRVLHTSWANRRLLGQLYRVVTLHDGVYPVPAGSPPPINVGRAFEAGCSIAEEYHRLAGLVAPADRVIVRCPAHKRDMWAHVLQGMNVHGEIFAPEITETRAIGIGRFDGTPTYIVAKGPLNLRDRMLKRGFDLTISLLALLLLAPLFLVTALAIKLDSSGPVFFRQKRIGRQNRLFYIYKFRSMHASQGNELGIESTARNDSRITTVGAFIRRTSIDELPQILNVIKGDMSIVGPRPHAVYSTASSKFFWEVDARYWYRHACKPGMTGLAQIRGFRGATHFESDLTNRLEADLEYLGRWSIWSDIAIVFRTAGVLVHRNAY